MKKQLIYHDLCPDESAQIFAKIGHDTTLFPANDMAKHCIGCFGCWIKTPGQCLILDGFENLGTALGNHGAFTIISRLTYGGYSPAVKRALDRSIGYILPFFRIVEGEMHHTMRYETPFDFTVHFYSETLSEKERDTALALVKANGLNLGAKTARAFFHSSVFDVKEALS